MKKKLKKSHNAEKTERGTFCDFSTSILSQNAKKIEGNLLRKKIPERVQFGVFLKFCITFGVELFWSLQVYRKIFLKNTDEKP